MEGTLYTLVVIVGPILLAAVLLFAVLRNRKAHRERAEIVASAVESQETRSRDDRPRAP